MKKTIALILTLVLALSLIACSSGADKQPAIDAYNEASEAYNELAELFNSYSELVDPSMLSSFEDMGDIMDSYNELLSGDQELTQEQVDEIVEWCGEATGWSVQLKTQFEDFLNG
ncbi:MAG: hypothetical protein Q4C04_04175 [Clostridia bacterium]|nr:hypothetical protein [Clostridia bacterium]